ncbi:hypothetical protein GCM10028773_50480 [Spirosoma koreense]
MAGYGQHTEFSVRVGTGLFSYRGNYAASETKLNLMDAYVSNPYGRASRFSYGVNGQVQQLTKQGLIYGGQLGYERLSSRVAITALMGDFGPIPANGRAVLKTDFINVNPFIGRRFGSDDFCVDATVGLDAAIGLNSRVWGSLVLDQPLVRMETNSRWPMPDVDIRPRLNLTGYCRAFGLSIGYSHGLSNYAGTRFSDDAKIYSQFWRASLTYRLGKRP